MKDLLLNFYRCVVGSEYGWFGECNEQWYYFIALVINIMLTWQFRPDLIAIFVVAAGIHFITVCVYSYGSLYDSSRFYSVLYYVIHMILYVICFVFDWELTLLTSSIVIIGYFLAPDCIGDSFFMMPIRKYIGKSESKKAAVILAFHTIMFLTFAVIALNLPISLWTRITIIVTCMILHPIIDYLESECIIISDATNESIDIIVQIIKDFINKKK